MMVCMCACAAYKFHADQEGDWLQIYNLAQTSSNRIEFIELLKAGGFLESSNVSLDQYYDRLKDDVETKWTRRGALKGRDQDYEAGRAGQR
jgi:hypothetical protein